MVSEPLRPSPDTRVIEWIDAQALETLFLSAITVAELRAGVALLPAGKRRAGLHESLETRVLPLFAGRVLPFDLGCTQASAELMAKARASGLAIAGADGYIAAIAAAKRRAPRLPGVDDSDGMGLDGAGVSRGHRNAVGSGDCRNVAICTGNGEPDTRALPISSA